MERHRRPSQPVLFLCIWPHPHWTTLLLSKKHIEFDNNNRRQQSAERSVFVIEMYGMLMLHVWFVLIIILDKPKSFGKQNQLYAVLKRGTPYIICANCNTPKRKKLQSNGRRWTLSLVQQSKAELFMNWILLEISFYFDNDWLVQWFTTRGTYMFQTLSQGMLDIYLADCNEGLNRFGSRMYYR